SPPTVNDTGYLVVNQPTVRDRSTSPASSPARPCPSTPMPIAPPPVPKTPPPPTPTRTTRPRVSRHETPPAPHRAASGWSPHPATPTSARHWQTYPPPGAPPAARPGPPPPASPPRPAPPPPRGVGLLIQQRRPPGKRRPRRRQRHLLPAVMLGPRDVEILQQDPPRHRVDGQMVNDQHQLAPRGHPQRPQHRPRGRAQPRPRPYQRLLR